MRSARKFSPIYYINGEKSLNYIDKISEYITENILKPEEKDFNQNIVFGADISATNCRSG